MPSSARTLRRTVLAVVMLGTSACGGSSDSGDTLESDDTADTTEPAEGTTTTADGSSDSGSGSGDETIPADACSLLDADFLDEAFADVESTFGGALDFNEPLQDGPSAFCTWPDAGGGQSFSLKVEDAATSETDDHSGRAYNIDEEPIVEPQDGPGTKAVLLIDNAFADVGGEGLTYGYFFVEGDVTVFLESTGFDAGLDALRTLADEAGARLLAG